jgi:hypothetical protein
MPDLPSPPLPACLTASSFAGHPPHLSTSNPSLATEILPGPPPLAAIAPPLGKTTASTNHHIRKSGNVLTYLPAMDPGSTYVNQLAGPAASGQVIWTPPPAVPLPVQPAQQQMQQGDEGEQSGSRKRKRARVDKPYVLITFFSSFFHPFPCPHIPPPISSYLKRRSADDNVCIVHLHLAPALCATRRYVRVRPQRQRSIPNRLCHLPNRLWLNLPIPRAPCPKAARHVLPLLHLCHRLRSAHQMGLWVRMVQPAPLRPTSNL